MLPVCATLFETRQRRRCRLRTPRTLYLLYNLIPQQLAFSQLKLLSTRFRLPTLAPTPPSPSPATLPPTSTSTAALSSSPTSSRPMCSPCAALLGSSTTQISA
ncbi:hypothetical protein NL676_001200 [Syzygium grande]|nr:hypothetical protein NL676_001200 [Syzygium grande]